MTRTGAFTQPYLRGVGKRSTLGVENSVATYVDGVYLASSISALLDLRGIERVEVLNGPQGTLFGRNATGGVIQVVTRDPSPETSGEAELHAGTYGYVRGDAVSDRRERSDRRQPRHEPVAQRRLRDQPLHRQDRPGRGRSQPRCAKQMDLAAGDGAEADSRRRLSGPRPGFLLPAGRRTIPPIGQPRVQGFRDGDQDAPNRYRFRYGGVSLQGGCRDREP